MAAAGSWPSIERYGLRSTSALLDLFEIDPVAREQLECQHRPEYVSITHPEHGQASIRDQKPMSDAGLVRALAGTNLTPADWYRLLNSKVFFWLTEERLFRMLNAAAYRGSRHTVIVLKTSALVQKHLDAITLAPMNTGATKPRAHRRGPDTFRSVTDFPYEKIRANRGPRDVVVELAVDKLVSDVSELVLRVDELGASDLPLPAD